ncbi:hypothetical protein [uncultured Ruminococcus sp.]|uniref:hypothetical protein n=1 Tax=uncultured Ruminococcus sp. TaxID=165186 RepID=UPI00345C3621
MRSAFQKLVPVTARTIQQNISAVLRRRDASRTCGKLCKRCTLRDGCCRHNCGGDNSCCSLDNCHFLSSFSFIFLFSGTFPRTAFGCISIPCCFIF